MTRLPSRMRIALAVLALFGLGAAGPGSCFEPSRRLSPAGFDADQSFNFKKSIATLPDGSVHATWHAGEGNLRRVFYRRSLDEGRSWEPPVVLSDPHRRSEHPAIAAAEGAVYVAWHQTGPGGVDVVLRRSLDTGGRFEPSIPLSASGSATHVSLAAFGPYVHAAFPDARSGNPEIYVRSSANRGAVFDPAQRLSDEPYESWVPSIDAWGDVAVVAWVDYRDANEEEYLRVSRDAGISWEPAVRVTTNPADSWAPSVAVRGETIFLTWFDRRPAGLLDGDVEAALDAVMSLLGLPVTPAPPRDPALYYLPPFQARLAAKRQAVEAAVPVFLASGGDPAALAHRMQEFERRLERWSRGWGIFLARSPDLGTSFEPARLIATPGGPAARPSLDVAGPFLHVAWYDLRHGEAEVYYRQSPDLGAHFRPEQRVTTTPGQSQRPSLAAEGPRVHIQWVEVIESEQAILYTRGLVLPPSAE